MQNIQERLTGLWPATGASSRRTARFAVSISASLTVGLTTSVDMGKAKSIENGILKKITDFPRVVLHFFSRNLTCLPQEQLCNKTRPDNSLMWVTSMMGEINTHSLKLVIIMIITLRAEWQLTEI